MENRKEEQREYEDENEKMNYFYSDNVLKMKSAYDTYGLNLVPRVNRDMKARYLQKQLMLLQSSGFSRPISLKGAPFSYKSPDEYFLPSSKDLKLSEYDEFLRKIFVPVGLDHRSHQIGKVNRTIPEREIDYNVEDNSHPKVQSKIIRCNKAGCMRSYNTYARYQKHLKVFHNRNPKAVDNNILQ